MPLIMGWQETSTAEAQSLVLKAQYEAVRLQAFEVSVPHLFLAILSMPESLAGQALEKMDVPVNQVRSAIEFIIKRQVAARPRRTGNSIPLGADIITVLNEAAEEVVRLGDGAVGTSHVLLGILRKSNVVTPVLERYGVTYANAQQIVAALPRATEHADLSEDDHARLRTIQEGLPRGVPWWRRLERFTRRFPLPVALIVIRFLGPIAIFIPAIGTLIGYEAHAWGAYMQSPTAAHYAALQNPTLKYSLEEISIVSTLYAIWIAALWLIVIVGCVQLLSPSMRSRYAELVQMHRLVLGWVIVIVVRLFLGIPSLFGQSVPVFRALQTIVFDLWFAVWLIILIVNAVRHRRTSRTHYA